MMRLRTIQISNFRKFIQPVIITGLTDGMNVLAGDNEDGKSTVLQAIKAASFTKHNTSSTASLQPYNSAAMPEVLLEFDLKGGSYWLRKTFGRKGVAEFRTPSGIFNGPDAEAKLQEICLTGGADRTKDSSSMWGVLWVEQGKAFTTPEVGDLGKQTLSNALENELGKVLGGDQGQAVLTRIRDLQAQWYTGTGKEFKNSEYKEAEKEFADIDKQYTECLQNYHAYEEALHRLQHIRKTLKNHETARTIETAKQDLETAIAREKTISEKRTAATQLVQIEQTRTLEYKVLTESFRSRRNLIADATAIEKQLQETDGKLAEIEKQHEQASKRLFEMQKTHEEADASLEIAATKADEAERHELSVRLDHECARLKETLAQAKACEQEAQTKLKEAGAIKIDAAALTQLQSLERSALQSEARFDAIATRLEFAPDQGRSIRRDGTVVDSDQPLLLTEKTSFELEGWGSIIVSPGGADLEKIRHASDKARADFDKALGVACVNSTSEAAELERTKNQLASEHKSLLRDVMKFAPAGIAAVEDELNRAAARLTDATSVLPPKALAPSSAEAAKDFLDQARKVREDARRAAQQHKIAAENAEAIFRKVDHENQMLVSQRKQLEQQRITTTQKLDKDRLEEPDDRIDQQMTEAKIVLERTVSEKKSMNDVLKTLNADAIDQEIIAARLRIQNIEREIAHLQGDQRELQGSLQTFGNSGVAEEVERLKGRREQSMMAVERTRRKARAIKLLWDTLCEAEHAAKEELSGPLMRHLEPFVTQVFDNGKLGFNKQNFSITHLQRAGVEEEYERLSLGTREQLSVLTRLAFAQLLTESNIPAFVILDDALVYSDSDRLEKMQNVLLRASNNFQVIVLTCRERDYAHLQTNIIRLETCSGSGAGIIAANPGQTRDIGLAEHKADGLTISTAPPSQPTLQV